MNAPRSPCVCSPFARSSPLAPPSFLLLPLLRRHPSPPLRARHGRALPRFVSPPAPHPTASISPPRLLCTDFFPFLRHRLTPLCAPRAVSSLRRGGGSTTQLGQQRRTCSNYSERATKADVISRSFPFLDRFDLSRICLASGVDIDRVSINRARCCSFTPTFTFDLRLESKEPNRSKHEIGKKELS